jgi:2-polyprenyl-6-methoxyphenol hydroxylase-like FAD-dependent oxidoreductase
MDRTPQRKAVVVGCGIAGPVAAMFLQRAGVHPVVYEAAETPSDCAGSFLMVTPNGLGVLRTLGVLDDLARHGLPCSGMTMWSSRGRRLGQVRHDHEPGGFAGSLLIKRGLLHRVLREEAVRRGIPVEFGRRLVDLTVTDDGGVVAAFEDGTSASGDMLVGSDGIYSRTRQLVEPLAPKPSYTGRISAGGFLHNPAIRPSSDALNLVLGRRAFFGYHVRPSGEVYWFSDLGYPGQPTRRELAATPREEWKQRLLDLHRDDPYPVPDIIRGLDGEFAVYPLYDVPPLPTWHRGPVALIGDAAHATSPYGGQGASMAMESAIVLAKCVRDIPDVGQAFASYQALRKERAERLVRLARRNGRHNKPVGPVAMSVRDLLMPLVLKAAANARARSWVYTYSVDWDGRVA